VFAGQTLVCQDQARAEVTLRDGTTLVLAPNTVMSIDRFVYDPDKGVGAAAFALLNGAFRAVTGKLAETGHPDLTVRTPLATIGVRGTDYWGGFLKAEELDVMLVKGKAVYVQNEAGTVDIVNPGDGTTVSARDQAPIPPKQWSQEKKDQAYRSVTFK
jgi:hypothetical protein